MTTRSSEPDYAHKMPMIYPGRVALGRAPLALQTAQQQTTVQLSDRAACLAILRNSHVLDDEVLTEHEPYFWPAEISNSGLDSYDTRMDPATTLVNFRDHAIQGVSFCDTHNHDELAFGRSFAATLVGSAPSDDAADVLDERSEQQSVIAAFYTIPGLKTNRVTTDDLILGMRSGIVKDVSVGFKPMPGFMYRCSICARDLWDWDCEHIPGVVYDITESDDADANKKQRYCFAWIVNAGLSEVSGAYDGATPQCMILKASREAEVGRIPARVVQLVESRCRVHLPDKRTTIPAGTNSKGDNNVTDEERRAQEERERQIKEGVRTQLEQLLGVARSSLVKLGIVKSDAADRDVPDVETAFRKLHAECERLQPLAADGAALRKQLIDETLVEGGRALGDKFVEADRRASLEKLDLETLQAQRDAWRDVADAKLGKGGRKTADERGAAEDTDDESSTIDESQYANA